jgi:competence protein ComEC
MFVHLFPDPHLRQVAGGLTFGLYKDPSVQQAMHRAGVEHVLAVSGFHFGIVAALTVFLAQGLALKKRALFSMVFLTVYLFIVGPLPSVIRAWCSAMVVLFGICLQKPSSGLNCLGVGLIASVFYDPSSVTSIGYQLSFLATAAILFFSHPCLIVLSTYLRPRKVSEAVRLSCVDQVLLLMLSWFLPALSLLFSVLFVVCPYQLAFLQDFSLLGVLYNLFIPALFSLAMPLVLLAVLLYPVPFVPHLFAWLSTLPLGAGLACVEHAPATAWSMVSGGVVPHAMGRAVLGLIFLLGMAHRGAQTIERHEAWKACL